MVDVLGHVGMALLWGAPAVLFADRPRDGLTFVAISLPFGVLPDLDIFLAQAFQSVHHHGITHTLLFVVAVALVAGPLVGRALVWIASEQGDDTPNHPVALSIGAILTGGTSHLFADVLSAPDIAQPIEPFWPLYNVPVSLDVIFYSSSVWNYGLLTAGLVAVGWFWSRRT